MGVCSAPIPPTCSLISNVSKVLSCQLWTRAKVTPDSAIDSRFYADPDQACRQRMQFHSNEEQTTRTRATDGIET